MFDFPEGLSFDAFVGIMEIQILVSCVKDAKAINAALRAECDRMEYEDNILIPTMSAN